MSVSYWNDRSSGRRLETDIAIIGGGITGLSCAYWLLKEDPTLRIAILEKHELGAGATGRNAGFITCGSVEHFNRLVGKHGTEEALTIWRFSEENLRLLREEIIQDRSEEFLFEQKGTFSVAGSETEFTELKECAQLMSSMKLDVEVLHQREVERRLNARNFIGGIKYCGDAAVHPILLLHGIRSRITGDIHILEGHEVTSIEEEANCKLVRTNRQLIEASAVVFATNGYSSLLHPYFSEKIFPTRGQVLMTSPVAPFLEAPCYANFVLDYFRQLSTGEVLIGGFRQLQKDVEKGVSDEVTPVVQNALENFLHEHLPAVRGVKITHRWSGVMGFSVDGQPLIGSMPTDPQVFFCGGFTGHGMGLAFHSGKILADCIFGRSVPAFLSAKRF